jgi:cyclopropane-fatty-acyl-phospholipid synthase
MNSKLYTGIVEHERFQPASHRLVYKLYMYALDLAELETLDQRFPLFGYNRLRPVSLYDRDYLGQQSVSIRRKVLEHVSAHISTDDVKQIILVTSPRLLGYVFNPASFYFCLSPSGRLLAAVTEVNNTFGEKHVYVLSDNLQANGAFPARFQADKAFMCRRSTTWRGPTSSLSPTSGRNWTSASTCTARGNISCGPACREIRCR